MVVVMAALTCGLAGGGGAESLVGGRFGARSVARLVGSFATRIGGHRCPVGEAGVLTGVGLQAGDNDGVAALLGGVGRVGGRVVQVAFTARSRAGRWVGASTQETRISGPPGDTLAFRSISSKAARGRVVLGLVRVGRGGSVGGVRCRNTVSPGQRVMPPAISAPSDSRAGRRGARETHRARLDRCVCQASSGPWMAPGSVTNRSSPTGYDPW
jgi:hypothetical protein